MRTYHIFREGIQQDCCWFRYRADANKRLREHWRPSKEKIISDEFDSLDKVPPCDVAGGLKYPRCEHCWRKLKIDWLNHIKIENMKKEKNFDPNVIDDSGFDNISKMKEEALNGAGKSLGK